MNVSSCQRCFLAIDFYEKKKSSVLHVALDRWISAINKFNARIKLKKERKGKKETIVITQAQFDIL